MTSEPNRDSDPPVKLNGSIGGNSSGPLLRPLQFGVSPRSYIDANLRPSFSIRTRNNILPTQDSTSRIIHMEYDTSSALNQPYDPSAKSRAQEQCDPFGVEQNSQESNTMSNLTFLLNQQEQGPCHDAVIAHQEVFSKINKCDESYDQPSNHKYISSATDDCKECDNDVAIIVGPSHNTQIDTTGTAALHISEADSASGPSNSSFSGLPRPTIKSLGSSAPSQLPRVMKRDLTLNPLAKALPVPSLTTQLCGGDGNVKASERVRRCMSSKEIGSLAPPSGSPYAKMLYEKEALEVLMRRKLATMRKSVPDTHPRSDESSSNSSRLKGERVNEMRNRRRAEHAQAVVDDLCQVVADLFIAESKLLNPSNYGVLPTTHRVQVIKNIYDFVSSFPLRYALGADTPSEVLLHMRLMAAVRLDRGKAAVHIHNLTDDSNWTSKIMAATEKIKRSLMLVTISCHDADGLLEYITRLLSTGGSRVLDADVMLSSDGIVLDRFVVEMNGRLRLDKLSNLIEAFLLESLGLTVGKAADCIDHASSDDSKISSIDGIGSPASGYRLDLKQAGPLYYRSECDDQSSMNETKKHLQEIERAVPLVEMLASSMSQSDICGPKLPDLRVVQPGSPPVRLSIRRSAPLSISPHVEESSDGSKLTEQPKQEYTSVPRRDRRVLVNRPATSDLDGMESENQIEDVVLDYVTVPRHLLGVGSTLEQREVPLIPFDELMLIETIGTGRVSTIYRAAWQRNKRATPHVKMVALKVAMVNPISGDSCNVDELRREADIAARLKHPNVVDLVGVAADPECFCLAYDFCEGGSLLSLLSNEKRYYEYLPISLDIANGMAYLHSRDVIHRDLKPSNILLTRDHRAKIADFGMSVANFGQELTAETGTYRYMAPEVVRHESYSSNADVYSFGLCLWQLITREVPFANMTPIQAAYAVAEGRRPTIPSDTPRRLQEIISACWSQDSHRRPSFTYITMALADYAKMAFSPANVGALTLQIANETLASVEGNSTVNVDFTTSVGTFGFLLPRYDSIQSNVGLEIE